jgi:hypothetical protein
MATVPRGPRGRRPAICPQAVALSEGVDPDVRKITAQLPFATLPRSSLATIGPRTRRPGWQHAG